MTILLFIWGGTTVLSASLPRNRNVLERFKGNVAGVIIGYTDNILNLWVKNAVEGQVMWRCYYRQEWWPSRLSFLSRLVKYIGYLLPYTNINSMKKAVLYGMTHLISNSQRNTEQTNAPPIFCSLWLAIQYNNKNDNPI